MKKIPVLIFLFLLFFATCFGQSNIQFGLDNIVHLSRANIENRVKYLKVGQVIHLTYWEHGCGMMKALERTLSIERTTSAYLVSYCELRKNMNDLRLLPLIADFSKSLHDMNPYKGCTTTKKIAIQDDYSVYLGIDASCEWMGFTTLIKAIFSVLPHDPENKTCLKDW